MKSTFKILHNGLKSLGLIFDCFPFIVRWESYPFDESYIPVQATSYKGAKNIKSLGSIPFYKKKQKTRIGEGAYWKASTAPIEFHELLTKFHKERVEHLKTYSWIIW